MSVRFYTARTQTGEIRRVGIISSGPAVYAGTSANTGYLYHYHIPGAYFTRAEDAQAVYPGTIDPEATYFVLKADDAAFMENWGFTDVINLAGYSSNSPLRLTFGDYSYADCYADTYSMYIKYNCSCGYITYVFRTYSTGNHDVAAIGLVAPGYSQFQTPGSDNLYYYNAMPLVLVPIYSGFERFAIGCQYADRHYWTPPYVYAVQSSDSAFYRADGERGTYQDYYSQEDVDAGEDDIGYFFRTFWNGIGFSVRHSVQIHNENPSLGTVSASPASASYGDTITLTVTPDAHYALDTISAVNAEDDTPIDLLQSGEDEATGVKTYVFTMPEGNVIISAAFRQVISTIPITVTYQSPGGKTFQTRFNVYRDDSEE